MLFSGQLLFQQIIHIAYSNLHYLFIQNARTTQRNKTAENISMKWTIRVFVNCIYFNSCDFFLLWLDFTAFRHISEKFALKMNNKHCNRNENNSLPKTKFVCVLD